MVAKISLNKFSNLSVSDRQAWDTLQRENPNLHSPYFSYDFQNVVNAVRGDVEVLRFADANGKAIGFLPFRRNFMRMARPTAGPMDDLHGVISAADADISFDADEVSELIGGYSFSAVPAQQFQFGLKGFAGDGNYVLDLTSGFDAYIESRSEASSNFRRAWRKAEKLLKTDGVTVQHDIWDEAVFERMIELKRDALAEAGHFDLFSIEWPKELLEELHHRNLNGARGVLSTLQIDGEVAAICYCMRSENVLHYWFPSYEPRFQKQQPGMALLFSLAEWASHEGMNEFHLGQGDVQYKRLMASFIAPMRHGMVEVSVPNRILGAVGELSYKLDGRGKLLSLPAKALRKWERMALFGTVRA